MLPIVYGELKQIAHGQMRNERRGHTLQTTAVVHEAYLKMVDLDRIDWRGRAYFFAAAARIMRRILIDHARHRRAQKRSVGGRLPLDEAVAMGLEEAEELIALNEALVDLERLDPRQCRIVELRHFAGLQVKEAAEVLGVSTATVKRDWRLARAWLHRRLVGGGPGASDGL